MIGVGAPLAAVLRPGSGRAQGTPEGAGAAIVVPGGLRRDLPGARVTYVGTSFTDPFEAAAFAAFTGATGIEVERVPGPESAGDRLAQYRQLLASRSGDVDVMMIDVVWPGVLAEHAVDLSDAIGWQGQARFERLLRNNTVAGKLVCVPWFLDAGLLYYRTDLLEEYDFDGPPATWAELEAMAATIQEGERAAAPDFQGYVFQGRAYEGLTSNALEWQASHGGVEIVDAVGVVSIDNPGTVAALERAARWVGTISPPGVTEYEESEALGVWRAGNAAFMRNWPYAFEVGQEPSSPIRDRFGVAALPMGDGASARHAGTLGGWQLMVSAYAENREAAVELVKYLTSREVQKAHAIAGSYPPTIPDLYGDEEILAARPYYEGLVAVFLDAAVARPSTLPGERYEELSRTYSTAVHQILTGGAEAGPRLEELQGTLVAIVAAP